MIHWSMGWVFDVLFCGRNISSTDGRPGIEGFAGQRVIFLFIFFISLSSFFTKDMKISDVIQAFLFAWD